MKTAELVPVEPSNPFPVAIRESQTASGDTANSRAIAEAQGAMVIAKKFPRDVRAAMDLILISCERPSLAEDAIYIYNKGGTNIEGPSIRLAEAMAQHWGNMEFGVRELEQRNGESTVEAYAWDIESNTRSRKEFQVKHEIYVNEYRDGKKTGKKTIKKLSDPRDIYELAANMGARRMRACILAVIPGDVTDAAVTACNKTLKAKVDVTPESIKKLVTAFGELGVTEEMISKRIQRRIDSIVAGNVVQLKKIYASIRDGISKASDWFEIAPEITESQAKPAIGNKE